MGKERRQAKRFTVVDLDIFLQGAEEKLGNIANISEGGLLIFAQSPMEKNVVNKFRIPFNKTVNGQVNFDFEAKIVWSAEDTLTPGRYSIGLEYTQNPELQNHFVQQMINIFGGKEAD